MIYTEQVWIEKQPPTLVETEEIFTGWQVCSAEGDIHPHP